MVLLNTLTQQKNNKFEKIAFFDSGVGGLTVYSKFRKLLPFENCIYLGDTKHLPYGNKTKEELISYSRDIFDFFKSKNVKAVVMACNTSSAATYSTVSKEYDFKIYPIIQSCAGIIAKLNIDKLGVFATQSTINSGVYEKEIKKYNPDIQVFAQSCPNWVDIVESNTQFQNSDIIKSDLEKMLENKPDKVILGCTHYPYLLKILMKYAPIEMFIDPSEIFVEFIKSDLEKNNLLNSQKVASTEEIYVTSNPELFKKNSKMFYDVKRVTEIDLECRV